MASDHSPSEEIEQSKGVEVKMARMRMTDDFLYRPVPTISIRYKKDKQYSAPLAAVNAAVKAGKAVKMRKDSREEAPVDESTSD